MPNELYHGSRFSNSVGFTYVLNQLTTGHWILIDEKTGNIWRSSEQCTDPEQAFGGHLSRFTHVPAPKVVATAPECTSRSLVGNDKESVKTHPAFGMVGFTRRSGGKSRLFGSELASGQTISLQVRQAEEVWRLSEKTYFAESLPLIEVEMTPAQFAELITTMNVGYGVPCTIRRVNNKQVPDFVDNETLRDKIIDDLQRDTTEIVGLLSKLSADLETTLESSGLSKVKREALMSTMNKIRQEVSANMPFVLDQYVEGVEKVTASAKAEVEAFVMHTVTQLGLSSLQDMVSTRKLGAGEA